MSPGRARLSFCRIGSVPALAVSAVLSLALTACTSGGGGASNPLPGGAAGGTTGSTAGTGTGPVGGFVNPAWTDPVQAPSRLWPKNPAPDTLLADWFQSRPWLLDRSMWVSHMRNGGAQPPRERLGAYGVGNGRCFGLVGLSYPLNTLHGMMGPSYQLGSNGYFGDLALGLDLYPRTIMFDEEWVWKPRRAAVTVTKARSAEVEFYTVDFAPPGIDAIARVVIGRNPSTTRTISEVQVTARLLGDGITVENGSRMIQLRGNRKMTVGAAGAAGPIAVAGTKLRVPLGTLLPGEERAALVYCVFSGTGPTDEARRLATISTVETAAPDAMLDATRAHWEGFFASGASFEFPDPKVQDFVDDMTCTVAVQIAENGCATPMSRYTSTWMRDQEGALRLFLREGRPGPVRRMLDSYYRTSILSNGIHNSMATDRDVASAVVPPDWMQAEFMPGRIPVEAPSYIPIELWEHYRATGDDSLLREQYDFAKAAVLRQERSPSGLMRFNGDEPFRWVMMVALGLYEPEQRGWSSNSAFLFVAAAERMAKVAALLGKTADAALFQAEADKVRAATEANFWLPVQGHYDVCKLFYANIPVAMPFEDISLMPIRIGYGDASHPNVKQNVLTVKRLLERADGLVQSHALINGLDAYDGHIPGYWLQNLTLIDHPDAERTFNALERAATMSGEIAEGQYAGGRSVVMLQYGPDGNGAPDVTARYRPWEGGIVAESILQYLFGEDWDAPASRLALVPHVPNGWGGMAARGLQCGGRPYDVEVRDFGNRRLERVTNRGTQPLVVTLGASVAAQAIGDVRLDGVAILQPPIGAEFGRMSFSVARTLAPGEWIDLDFDYLK